MEIRLANKEDIPQIAELWLKMVNELYPDNTPSKITWSEYCNRLFDSGLYYIYLAINGDDIVGFIDGIRFLEPSTGKEHGVCQHIYIEPEYRKTMVAFRLEKQMYKIFREFGIKVFDFFCGTEDKNIWMKKGYKPVRTMFRRIYV